MNSTFNIGFSTGGPGTVTAATKWEEPPQCMTLKPSIHNSYEELFHQVATNIFSPNFMLLFRSLDDETKEGAPVINKEMVALLSEPRYERYIGVIYKPESQKQSHCTITSLPREFDAVIYLDNTTAVEPIDPTPTWKKEQNIIET